MHTKTQLAPLTEEERQFAEKYHPEIYRYLKSRRLDPEEWYDVVILRYLLSVKKWFQRPELHRWKFTTIVRQAMRSAIGNHYEKEKHRIPTISLEEIVPWTDEVSYKDTITAENLDYINYGEEEMNISYNVKLPERKYFGACRPKPDDQVALEVFLGAKSQRNMAISYDTEEEAKRRLSALQHYRRTRKLQEKIEIYRVELTVYVVKNKGGKK